MCRWPAPRQSLHCAIGWVMTWRHTASNTASLVTAPFACAEFEPLQMNLPVVPRIAMNLVHVSEYRKLTWLGRGLHENYADRKTGAAIGHYESTAAGLYHHYSRPQETGNKTDVRWMALTSAAGTGIWITGDELLSMTALPLETADLDHDRSPDVPNVHGGDIDLRDIVRVHIDLRQMRVADNSSAARPLPKYQIPAQGYEYAFRIQLTIRQ